MSESVSYIRYDRLRQVCFKALEESQKVITDESLKQCYPSLITGEESSRLLETIKINLYNSWKLGTEKEFESIFEERDIKSKLDELDKLIFEARQDSPVANQVQPDQLTPNNIIASHLIPLKENNLKALNHQLELVRNENLNLLKELDDLSTLAKDLKNEINGNFEALNKLNEIYDDDQIEKYLQDLIIITQTENEHLI
ncbi:hypothetical protein WICMUC_005360 [Wickerhamomyces mucosus]|uniref:Uncharacterized protein n=1 Tax=Wickerhamomyces mucosus TaxID=1378264 RepID=A0A9P8P736_9ASCO|nr:hypothetical protein WICMUC_005360 [Wickerhamomyces mucosus]